MTFRSYLKESTVDVDYEFHNMGEYAVVWAVSGGKKVGHVSGTWETNVELDYDVSRKCSDDVQALAERHPEIIEHREFEDGSVGEYYQWLLVGSSILDSEFRNKGIGSAMYARLMEEWGKTQDRPFLFLMQQCARDGYTSPAARRVWKSLSRNHDSNGSVILYTPNKRLGEAYHPNEHDLEERTYQGHEMTPVRFKNKIATRGQIWNYFYIEFGAGEGELDFVIVKDSKGEERMFANDIWVSTKHRRQGMASALYTQVEFWSGLKFHRGQTQTDMGKALWGSPDRPFGGRDS